MDPVWDEVNEYQLKRAVRGKHAARYARERVEAVANVHIWAPLEGFSWSGAHFALSDDSWIKAKSAYKGYESPELVRFISEDELERCRHASHWIHVIQTAHSPLSPAASVNGVLLGLWMVRPTRASVPLRFHEVEGGERTVVRVLDRFQWIEGRADDAIRDSDLREAGSLFAKMRRAYMADPPLKNALVLTLRGCMSHNWQSAFMCFSAALEGLLGSDQEGADVEQLGAKLVRLIGHRVANAVSRADRLRTLYAVRADIIHGRGYTRTDPARNLDDLGDLADTLRSVWQAVLAVASGPCS